MPTTSLSAVLAAAGVFFAGSVRGESASHQVFGRGPAFALAQPELLRGPYLQAGSPTGVTVCWRTSFPADGLVRYGTNAAELDLMAFGTPFAIDHRVALVNLQPNTRYFYAVGTALGDLSGGPDHYFITAPAAPQPTRIWAIGDSGTASVGYPWAGWVRDAYVNFAGTNHTDVWLMLGDNAYGIGADEEYQVAVFQTFPELLRRFVLWSTIGNHETYSAVNGHFAYLDIFVPPTQGEAGGVPSGTKHYYSFDHANIHFVCLDSEVIRGDNPTMLAWLEQDLADNDKDWLVAFWHSPPYTKGTHDSDWPADTEGHLLQMRENVVPILENYGVDLVLCGHSHNYERSYLLDGHYGFSDTLEPTMLKDAGNGRPGGTGAYRKADRGPAPHQGAVYVVAGSSGWVGGRWGQHPAMAVNIDQLGSLVIDVDGQRMDVRFLRETGAVEDWFTILKGAEPEPLRIASIEADATAAILRWKSEAGKQYRVLYAETLPAAEWLPGSDPILATGATTAWTNASPPLIERAFFRVVQLAD